MLRFFILDYRLCLMSFKLTANHRIKVLGEIDALATEETLLKMSFLLKGQFQFFGHALPLFNIESLKVA